MASVLKTLNPVFEACLKDRTHPYHNRPCDKHCPDYPACSEGEIIIVRAIECSFCGAKLSQDEAVMLGCCPVCSSCYRRLRRK